MIRTVIAVVLLGAGVLFICIAALGVARLPDAFQRMHASTKAGSLGTALVILGVLVGGGAGHVSAGALTIVYTLLTLSVASQLLGRAAYMSGAALHGLGQGDALANVLEREEFSLEDRTEFERQGTPRV